MLFHRVAVIAIDKALYEARKEILTGRWFPRTAAHCQHPTGTPCPWKRPSPCFSCHPFSSSSSPAPCHPDWEFIRRSTSSTQLLKSGSTSARAPWRARSSEAVDEQWTDTAGVDSSKFLRPLRSGEWWMTTDAGWRWVNLVERFWTERAQEMRPRLLVYDFNDAGCCWVKLIDTPLNCKSLTIWPLNFIHYLIYILDLPLPAKCASKTYEPMGPPWHHEFIFLLMFQDGLMFREPCEHLGSCIWSFLRATLLSIVKLNTYLYIID